MAKPIPSYQVYKGTVVDLVNAAVDFVLSKIALSVGTREAGVFRFDTVYGLNQTMTEDVSDHYPVYAVFWTGRDGD